MEKHELILESHPYFDTPIIYIAKCSCGEYNSGKTSSKLDAEKRWLQHMVAKTQNQKDQ